jgi:hypothetical protein
MVDGYCSLHHLHCFEADNVEPLSYKGAEPSVQRALNPYETREGGFISQPGICQIAEMKLHVLKLAQDA